MSEKEQQIVQFVVLIFSENRLSKLRTRRKKRRQITSEYWILEGATPKFSLFGEVE